MLVTLREVLKDAQEKNYAVGLFNTVNLEMAKAVIEAAEEKRSPVIVGSAEVLLNHCSIEELSAMLLPMIERASIPVVLHYDHGLTPELVEKAMTCGFSSVMYDCSSDSYEENVRKCADMVRTAKRFGASVEAELGHVGAGAAGSAESGRKGGGQEESESSEDHSVYTQPEQAADFVERTGVDALAVAIGTAHGPYLKKPRLDLDRLSEIREKVSVPLVLHGGSGLSDEDFRNCVERGISKINIFTDIDRAGAQGARRALEAGGTYLTDLMPIVIGSIKDVVVRKLELFGSVGRA